EAFIINGEKKDELIAQDPKSAEIIRPILRGRDIKRYGYDFADLWLINTHNGIKEKGIKPINIDDYPAIKKHLDQYWTRLEKRADQGVTPYNLRNCAYMEDFYKQKIMYADISEKLSFCLVNEPIFCNNTTYFITSKTENLEHLIKFLNSDLINWYYKTLSVQLGEKAVRLFSIYVLNIPVPKKRDGDIYNTYKLTEEEINYIKNKL
ncbi:TaqI-like C-terminal specificity domain-containing protein, partial [Ornithobacterium rhinotracheale]|uniref:TaqI-like C-terminal specificity domain-containing protein n=2 Tax=Ornithobacterium rhinotracheale TaxID=28251 RepID=UPI00403709B9